MAVITKEQALLVFNNPNPDDICEVMKAIQEGTLQLSVEMEGAFYALHAEALTQQTYPESPKRVERSAQLYRRGTFSPGHRLQ